MGANDPQIEMAQAGAAALAKGGLAVDLATGTPVDIAASLSPFTIVFDAAGNPLASSALLDGKTPTVPLGVLTSALESGENRVTWQPQPGVRIAAVVDAYKNAAGSGYVLVGRSLHEVEARIDNLTLMLTLAWASALIASFLVIIFSEYLLLHPKEKS
ncbi:MAG: hypothetical protein AB9897_02430 [Anaerolineaceae bacterium]